LITMLEVAIEHRLMHAGNARVHAARFAERPKIPVPEKRHGRRIE